MLVSELIDKKVFVGKTLRGVALGVGVSLKTSAVKYLLCANIEHHSKMNPQADFAVSVSAIERIGEEGIVLSKLRTLFPKNCAKLFLQRPVFSEEGLFLGGLVDLELREFTIVKLYTDRGGAYPFSAVAAATDAVILKKMPPYPIGQRIPAYASLRILHKEEPVVTRSVLKEAMRKQSLVRFTLSLPPFEESL
ncbi:MAG: hypothetical protein IJX88_02470 [Clostridia bacterium]|nr:hypothetical protein [Clostridia bacterium]